MSRFQMTLIMALVITFISGTMTAQTVRSIGARSIGLDDGNPAHARVFLVDNLGSLGIDNTGAVTGAFPNSCGALLDLSSITKGFLPPRMSTLQEAAICGGAPPEGLMLYNLVTHSLDVYTGSAYGQTWNAKGNFGINPVIDFVGTNDPTDLVFRTNFTERMRILANGNVGIGSPIATNTHVQITEMGSQTALNITSAGTGTGVNITTAGTNNLLVVNGTANASVANLTGDAVWDSRIIGDQSVTGIQKVGASIWLDGNSATHQIVTDAPVNIGTKNANTTSLITNNIQRLIIDGTGKVTITPDAGTTNNVLVVNGFTDATIANVAGDPVWDARINGDLLVTGRQKVGGSIWLDGTTIPHQIVTDQDVNIGTKIARTVGIITGNTQRLKIDATGNTTVTGGIATTTKIDGGGNVIFNVNNTTINEGASGQFTISSKNSSYAEIVKTTGEQGVKIQCTQQKGSGLSSDTHFLDFADGNGVRGGIRGQSKDNFWNDPSNIKDLALDIGCGLKSVVSIYMAAAAAPCIVGCTQPLIPGYITDAALLIKDQVAYAVATASKLSKLGVTYTSGAGDYAEFLKRENPDEKLYPGDIVGVKNGLISKNTDEAESIYSISLNPIVLGNVPPENEENLYNKVGFLGQVPVKVRGIVHEGDFIIASGLNDGVGVSVDPKNMTPENLQRLIGRAWTSSNFEFVKYINVAVGLNTKTMGEIMATQQSEIDDLRAQISRSATESALLKSTFDHIEKMLTTPEFEKIINK